MSPAMRAVGRYQLVHPLATGGMAHVWLGREGRHAVAVKQMLPAFASDKAARAMLADEARVSQRVQHPNVVRTLDLIESGGELFLVLEYVLGESLDRLPPPPPKVALAVVAGALRGLHAAHESKAEDGAPLELVHRDVSPQNIIVDVAGTARVLDFGVARARGRLQATREGQLKGKLAYLAPEQVHGTASRQSDLFSAGVVLWELLSGKRLFDAESEAEVLSKVLLCQVPPLEVAQSVLEKALAREPSQRFATAAEMADAIEALGVASPGEVAAWLRTSAGPALAEREAMLTARRRPSLALAAIPLAALTALAVALLARPEKAAPVAAAPPPPVVIEAPAPGSPAPAPPAPAPAPPQVVVVHDGTGGRKTPPKPDCTPPYTIGADGVKRFKVECLH
jgi:serine/threonine-protein kinase